MIHTGFLSGVVRNNRGLLVMIPTYSFRVVHVHASGHTKTLVALRVLHTWLYYTWSKINTNKNNTNDPAFRFLFWKLGSVIKKIDDLNSIFNKVQNPLPVIIQNLREDSRMPIEEVLVEDGVVVGQRLRETGQPGGRDLLQRRLVGLVTYPAHVQDHAVLRVHVEEVHFWWRVRC